jgi:hypothetical protein
VQDDLRQIKLFDSPEDAVLARDALEANGIHAVLSSDRLARKGWSWDGHLIQLWVSQNDVHAAKAFFAEAASRRPQSASPGRRTGLSKRRDRGLGGLRR